MARYLPLLLALACTLGTASGDGGRGDYAAEASQRGLEESLAAVSQAYVGGKRVYYLQPSSPTGAGAARGSAKPATGVGALPVLAGASSSADAAQEERINTLPARQAPRPARVVQHHLRRPGSPAAAAAPVQRPAFVPTAVAAAVPADAPPPAASTHRGLSSKEEVELARINQLRAQARHEWSRARALGHKQLLAEGEEGGGEAKAGQMQLVCFGFVSVAGTLLVFVRMGMPMAVG